MLRKGLLVVFVVLLAAGFIFHAMGRGAFGRHEAPGRVAVGPRPAAVDLANASRIAGASADIGAPQSKQILFGDLHVHTTFSFDAFFASLPLTLGEGAHPPADACDFARYCSALDFWSINDHAEGITPEHWRETVESIRECNANAGDPANPDTVAFLGWEWSDVGTTPADHYGHKNVVFAHTDEARIPARPIAAESTLRRIRAGTDFSRVGLGALLVAAWEPRLHDLARYLDERRGIEICPAGVPVRELPLDCLETAATPRELFAKLDDWGYESRVIPHGTTWGFYTPPGSDWRRQLVGDLHDPARQTLFEIYSGHGDSELYRDWRGVELDAQGRPSCPTPSAQYLPTCWRAGQIIEERCLAQGESATECAGRAATARRNAAEAFTQAHLTVPGAEAADWLDAGQCRDCREPSFNYRPAGAAQYVLALGNFDDPGAPRHFRFGFIGSSDNHFARPGTGYKEVHRRGFTESRPGGRVDLGPASRAVQPPIEEPVAESRPFDRDDRRLMGFGLFELERQSSFFMTGGLVAAHATGRDRASVWDSLDRREVYGTSGPRMLLWFDLINPPGTRGRSIPMGGEARMTRAPIFQVRAVGSYEQKPGCPEYAVRGLGEERLEQVCKGECYHPGDLRRSITRIEVVRIRPQQSADERIAPLIDDPWLRFECDPNPEGCAVTFSDPEFAGAARDAVYYVRAYEPPTPGINAAGVRCEVDTAGNCVRANLCSDLDDQCLAEHEPRAWASPIFVDWGTDRAAAPPAR